MKCPNCQKENVEEAKFCVECGSPLVKEEPVKATEEKEVLIEEVEEQETASQETEEQEMPEVQVEEGKKIWYYVSNNQSVGPYTEEEMAAMIQERTIIANTYIWKSGLKDWEYVKNSELAKYLTMNKQETSQQETEESSWYYVDFNNQQQGPYTKEEMIHFLQNGVINGNTFVWQQGMADWIHCKDASIFIQTSKSAPNFHANGNTTKQAMEIRSIPMAILLSIVTCGLYGLFWLYAMASDINRLNMAQGKPAGTDAFLVVILSIVTCGLYEIYFYWKAAKLLRQLQFENGYMAEDNGLIMMLLSVFGLGLISRCILQSTLNDIQRYA